MIVKNHGDLATSATREKALRIIEAGIRSVLPVNIMKAAVGYDAVRRTLDVKGDSFHLKEGRLFVIGGGKASGLMAQALESIVGAENITAGTVNFKGGEVKTQRVKAVIAGHPVPDRRGLNGVEAMLALKKRYSIGEKDIVVCLLSGGGSALMPYPVAEISLEDKQAVTGLLIGSGASIDEVNIVRKHLSRIKGGSLGAFYAPARVISLILSDVVGNDLATIASGPTVTDPSTFAEAHGVLKRYDLLAKAPRSVVGYIEKGIKGEAPETPKTLENCRNYVIGDNGLALEAMAGEAGKLGLNSLILTSRQTGDTAGVARFRAGEIIANKHAGHDVLLIGGETTIKLPPEAGSGGRNQHYAAVSMLALADYPENWLVAAVGTDGSDFLPDVAGAMVDRNSLDTAKAKGLDIAAYIEKCDSNTLLKAIGNSLVETGDTGTNVGDVIVYLAGK
ncbi:MAG: DUF4147 domain-containing protein [Dehalococcoidia bacterium]